MYSCALSLADMDCAAASGLESESVLVVVVDLVLLNAKL